MSLNYKNLTDKRYLRTVLKRAGISPERSQGQNFLICQEVVEAIIEALKDYPRVLTELGAGPGSLTQALVLSGWKVKAVEKDNKMIEVLKKSVPKNKSVDLEVVAADMRKEKWTWNEPYVVAGNIPYNLSGLIIRKITQLEPVPEAAVLMTQKEVGKKLTAKVSELNLISVAAQLWGKAELVLNVPKDCFWPKPKVDSQVVLMTPHDKNKVWSLEEREEAIKIAKKFFGFKRKQLGGAARRIYKGRAEEVIGAMAEAGIAFNQRPQEIEPEKWVKVVKSLKNRN